LKQLEQDTIEWINQISEPIHNGMIKLLINEGRIVKILTEDYKTHVKEEKELTKN